MAWGKELDFVSIGIVAAGYFTSSMSYMALGREVTYFGIELGICEFKYTA